MCWMILLQNHINWVREKKEARILYGEWAYNFSRVWKSDGFHSPVFVATIINWGSSTYYQYIFTISLVFIIAYSNWKGIATIHLPEDPSLPVGIDEILVQFSLRCSRQSGSDKAAWENIELMAVPQLLLFCRKACEELLATYVLDTDQTSRRTAMERLDLICFLLVGAYSPSYTAHWTKSSFKEQQ